MLNHKSILITGGTGSFGKAFVKRVFDKYPEVKRLVVYSRDELKQFEMSQEFSNEKYPAIRYFLGDVRDYSRLKRACQGIDIIIHAAALKQVPAAEYNPMEFIKTNIIGAQNVIDAALGSGAKTVVALSTDKAAAPINLYGATKLCSDKLFVAANNIKGMQNISFSVVRYGNVIGSRGSVVPFFLKIKNEEFLPVTHPDMTRFNITLDKGVDIVLYAIQNALGGEIFVPKIPSYRILDVAKAIAPKAKIKYTGIRPGEKLHEEMITETDSYNTIENNEYYIILPSLSDHNKADFLKKYNAKIMKEGFRYASHSNTEWLTVDEIRSQIRENIDPDFNA
ncbi:MAG: UDP-N-acetylglucosamine 4,6-dehydratase (inverting) [Bacteroidales bacterium]|nr:UDP-N-acetylglucosamine 4,6-dehydratase (inverting) [Bacteroidales bacterium]